MMHLAKLIALLELDVPIQNGVPSALQLEQAIRSAVDDFSARLPMRKVATVNIVSGQPTYSLPDDFAKFISLDFGVPFGDVLVMGNGLLPMNGKTERAMVNGSSLVIYPTPAYSASRTLHYAARYALDNDRIYQDMTEPVANVVLLKAKSLCLHIQASSTSGDNWSYSIGDETVNKSNVSTGYRQQAQSLEEAYLRTVKAMIGVVGSRQTPAFGAGYYN